MSSGLWTGRVAGKPHISMAQAVKCLGAGGKGVNTLQPRSQTLGLASASADVSTSDIGQYSLIPSTSSSNHVYWQLKYLVYFAKTSC